jgi:hypothetical protein
MSLIHVLMAFVPDSIGGQGAVQNCRRELERHDADRREAEAVVRRVAERTPAATSLRRPA